MSLIPRKSEVLTPQAGVPERLSGQLEARHGDGAAGARVLLVHSGHLGDGVLALAAMREARAALARAHITVVVAKPIDGLLRRGGWFDDVLTLPGYVFALANPARMLNVARLIRQVTRQPLDLAVAMTPDPEDLLFAALSLAPLRVGPVKDHNWVYTRGWLTHSARWDGGDPAVAKRYAIVARTAGWAEPGVAALSDLTLTADEQAAAREACGGGRLALLLVCGSAKHRRWPLSNYVTLAKRLREMGLRVGIVSGPGEQDLLAGIESGFVRDGIATHYASRPLTELVALCRAASLVVTVDSGPGHIAGASGAPTVYLIPRRKLATHVPPGAHVHAVSAESPSDIPVGEVIAAATAMLGRREQRHEQH